MKRFYFLSIPLILLLITACTGPQQTTGINDAAASIGSNTIIVQTDKSQEDLFQQIADILMNRGFSLEETNETLGLIQTGKSELTNFRLDTRTSYTIRANSSGEVIIRGKIGDGSIEKRGQIGSPARNAWKEMFEIANEFKGELSFK